MKDFKRFKRYKKTMKEKAETGLGNNFFSYKNH